MRSFIAPEQFPYETTTGWTYDSGDYAETMRVAMDIAGYEELRREQAEKRARGELMGIGVVVLHRGRRRRAAQAHGHPRPGDERRRRPARAPVGQGGGLDQRADAGPGPRDDVRPDRRRGARHPAGGRRGRATATPTSRRTASAPTAAARRRCPARAVAVVSRKVRDKARLIAATMLETAARGPRVGEGPLVRQGRPGEGRADRGHRDARLQRRADCPRAWRAASTRRSIYDPPNLTYPYGAYIAVVDIDPDTGAGHGPAVHRGRRLRRADQPDDRRRPDPRRPRRGRRHRADGGASPSTRRATASNSSFMDYLIPTALECPDFELGETVTPCPHHPLGAKGVGESPNVGSPPGDRQRGDRRAARDARRRRTSTCRARPPGCGRRCRGGPSRRNDAAPRSRGGRRSSPRRARRS